MALFSLFLIAITVLVYRVLRFFRLGLFMGPPQKQINPSLPQSWKYDVFLSFRGTDTRHNFLDHLYTTLVQQGIKTFKDDEELPRGETIRPSLLKAIEDSQIAVIVFSENYADSSWCLQELEHIMKCKVERAQIVIPIFYHIDPSEVRKHERKYGEGLAKLKSQKKNVKPWIKALKDARNLSGYVPDGSETEFIKEIVSTISKRLVIPSDNEDLIGIEDRLEDLKKKLAIDSEGVLAVGIWGLGGGGKTTLADAVYNEISTKFDGCCFVKNIREESSKHGLQELQKEILSGVLKIKKEEVVGDVRTLIKNRLRRKKVLLVLDDIDDADQLEALAGSHDWFNKGSRIIITSRDEHLLSTSEVNEIYNIRLLNHDEALKLFCKHAPRRGNHIEGYDRLSEEVVSYAGGLPLALKVMGKFLCDKDRNEWVSALTRLKDIPGGKILEKLKISYDGLEPLVKELFLDIACFFRGEKKDEAKEILEACGFHTDIGVKELIQKALITVTEEGVFDMHDLIQEMGYYIVQGNYPKNPKKHSRVWRQEDVKMICDSPTEENHFIKALNMKGMVPYSLPGAIANMKELRLFSCYGYPATSLPRNFQSTKLSYLRLEWSSLKQLWKKHFWEDDKIFPNLKVLDLSGSKNLIRTPDFDKLPCLERTRLNFCHGLRHIHPSISYHETLVSVEMSGCTRLKTFPPINGMKKLETLKISECSRLCKIPDIQTNMDNLVKLSLIGTGIEVVPSSIGQYCTNLLSLDLRHCKSLQSIEGNFHLLKRLKKFYISGCGELKIPAEGLFDVNCHLQLLHLFKASFKNLHPTGIVSMKFLGFLPSLTRLRLDSFSLINEGDISSLMCELSNLQVLDLSWSKFSRLPCSLLQLHSLKFLNLSYCINLVELPDLPASIAFLKADLCKNLKILDLPTNLRWLWRITLPMESILGDVERKVQSMLQGNAIKDYSTSLIFENYGMPIRDFGRRTLMLELPRNWYNEYNGFLICVKGSPIYATNDVITIKDVMCRENKDVLEGTPEETSKLEFMCYIYIPFGSLRHTSWWKSKHTTISFSLQRHALLKVELVPGRSKNDSIERVKGTTNSSKFWDKEPIKIINDSKSCIKVDWCHHDDDDKKVDVDSGDDDVDAIVDGYIRFLLQQ